MNTAHDTLRSLFIFDGLTDGELRKVDEIATELTLTKGEMLFSEGDKAIAFYGIVTGRVKIYRISESGAEFTVHIHGQGDLIAEAAIFDLKRYPAYCQALEDSRLVRIHSNDFVSLIRKHPDLSLSIMHAYSKRLRAFVRTLGDLSFGDVKSRLAGYLLRNAEQNGGVFRCTLNITKRELAALLGTVPETLSRTLRSFKEHDYIEENGQDIVILNPRGLKDLTGD